MKRFLHNLLIALFLVALCAVSSVAHDVEAIGKVVALRGEVNASSASGATRRLAVKMPVYLEDSIQTGNRGRVQILFSDKTIVSLGPKTDMRIAEYSWRPQQQQGAMKTVVKEGVFRVMGGSITRVAPEHFTTETPSATIGIRGSMYSGRVTAGQTLVLFEGGRGIYIANPSGQVEIATPGYASSAGDPGQPPSEAEQVEPEQLSTFSTDVAVDDDAEGDGSVEDGGSDGGSDGADNSGSDDESAASEAVDDDSPSDSATASSDETSDTAAANDELTVETTADDSGTIDGTVSVTTTDVVTDSSQSVLVDSAEATAATSATSATGTTPYATFSGRSLQLLHDDSPPVGTNDSYQLGYVSATTDNGVVNGAMAAGADVTNFSFSISPYDPSVVYSGSASQGNLPHSVYLLGGERDFTTLKVTSADPGEFTIFGVDGETFVDGGTTYKYADLAFAGPPTMNPLTSGIYAYRGPLLSQFTPTDNSDFEVETGTFDFAINFDNGKFFGVLSPQDPATPGDPTDSFIYGDVNGSTLTNLRLVGYGEVDPMFPSPPTSLQGVGIFGQLYGEQSQGVGLVVDTTGIDIYSQATIGDGVILAAGYRDVAAYASPTSGTVTLQGFAVGVAEDMSNPDVNRRLFMNSFADDFTLNLDRDHGVLSGVYSAPDVAGSTTTVSALEIGATHGSAVITDTMFVAEMGGSAVVVDGANSSGLSPYGNVLVVEDPDIQGLDYATWGYWEMAYADPSSGNSYHMHVPGSLWIAGERTPLAAVQTLIDSNFVGAYSGIAEGVTISAGGSMTELTNGHSNLVIDFAPAALTPVAGSLTFDEVTLNISSGSPVSSSGFSANVVGAASSAVNGVYYGPAAQTIGGDFDALMTGGERYIGIFGGNR